MPSYPFIILGLLVLGIMTLPPLIAAVIDMWRQEQLRKRVSRANEGENSGPR